MESIRRTLGILLTGLLVACGDSNSGKPVTGSGSGGVVVPSGLVLKAETVLPPGQSGFISSSGQAAGSASGRPGDYGPHVDDQRTLYWNFDAKPAVLGTKPGPVKLVKPGVSVYRDSFGVPIVYADDLRDLWYGVGYSVTEDRLFLLDAVRRTARGTLAELTGCGAVPADLQQRVVGYTNAEYQRFFDALTPDAAAAVLGYVDGVNARIAEVNANPSLLPAEYSLLSAQPVPISATDVLAAGVYITRFVAAEGGNEFLNIRLLKTLQARYGSARAGKDAFLDMTWLDDRKAAVSVPVERGEFSNQPLPADGRDAVFERSADWAVTLPESIWKGEGTGHSPAPAPCSQPSLPLASSASSGLMTAGQRELIQQPQRLVQTAKRVGQQLSLAARRAQADVARKSIVLALSQLRAYMHGGSHAYALAPVALKTAARC